MFPTCMCWIGFGNRRGEFTKSHDKPMVTISHLNYQPGLRAHADLIIVLQYRLASKLNKD